MPEELKSKGLHTGKNRYVNSMWPKVWAIGLVVCNRVKCADILIFFSFAKFSMQQLLVL